MPIEENLSPQLPSANFRMNFIQTCLVQTTGNIQKYNPLNMKKQLGGSDLQASEMEGSDS
jgi:hypothetical protein